MGSAILAYPAMKKIQEAYPSAQLYFWIFKKNQDGVWALDIIPHKNVIVMRSESLMLLCIDIFKNLRRIHKEKMDVVIDMELFTRFTSFLTYLSRAATRVGFHAGRFWGPYRGGLHTHSVMYNPRIHISRNFLSLVDAVINDNKKDAAFLKSRALDYPLAIAQRKPTQEERDRIWKKIKQLNPRITIHNTLVLVNPGINDVLSVRRWPIENYIGLAKNILEDENIFIALVGTAAQSFYGEKISGGIVSSRIVNLIGETSVEELLALCDISKLLISHDSGLVHLASLTKIHIIVLFGPETPALYAPLTSEKTVCYAALSCSPCISAYNHRRAVCKDNKCLRAIAVEEVVSVAKKVLYNISLLS